MENINLITIFLTGLITGGLTCMAVQGGLLAATIAQREEERLEHETKKTGNALPILSFLIAKLVMHALLGFLLGWFGSFFKMSVSSQAILQIMVGIFMVGTALHILNVHPIFRYFIIQPPKFLSRMIRNKSKSPHFAKASRGMKDVFAPAILGAFTIFIPCGTTQAMMALAIGTGNPMLGAAVLFAFILGTSPLFFVLGYFATKMGDFLHGQFMKVAAFAIILLAVFNINNAIALTGSNFTLENIWKETYCTFSFCDDSPLFAYGGLKGPQNSPVEEATINIETFGYNPDNLVVKKGSTVTFKVNNISGGGCGQSFVIPALGIQRVIRVGSSDTIQFTAPNEPTDITFMCSMGMFRGKIRVI